jgi:hypothetical protein
MLGLRDYSVSPMLRALTRRLEEDIARYAGSVDLTVIPAPRIDRVMPIDFGHADELILAGLRSAHGILGQTRHVVPLRDAA